MDGWARRVFQQRWARRRVIGAGLGTGFSVAFLAACGGNNNNNAKPATSAATKAPTANGTPSTAATAAPAASAAAATSAAAAGSPAAGVVPKRGGTYRFPGIGYPTTFDPHLSGASSIRSRAYSRLYCEASGPSVPATVGTPIPDAAASAELAPDGVTLTVKLKPNVKFHGTVTRLLTADDVVFSYDRYRGKIAGTPASPEAGNDMNIDTVTAIDPLTVQMKLKQQIGPYLGLISGLYTAYLLPVETGKAFDVATQVNGTGPWLLDSFTPGSQLSFKRNPEWHFGPDRPYLDGIQEYEIIEPAARETQFLGGNLDQFPYVPGGEVPKLQSSVKGVQLDAALTGDPVPLSGIAFSAKDPNSPWKDPRVRQAISMGIDRDAMTEAAYDIQKLKSLGVKADLLWNNFIPASLPDYWLDPKGSKIDPNVAKFFKYDPQAAKQLLSAAGFANGFKATYHYTDNYGTGSHTIAELTLQYLSKIGLDLTASVDDYQSVYVAHTRQGDFDGITFVPYGSFADAGDYLAAMYTPQGNRNTSKVSDAQLNDRIAKIQANTNVDDRKAQILDLQNYLGQQMYYVPMQAGAGPILTAYQPYIQNALIYHAAKGIGEAFNETYWGSSKA